jgi:hypothetical protein
VNAGDRMKPAPLLGAKTFRDRLAAVVARHENERATGSITRRGTHQTGKAGPEPADVAAIRAENERLRALLGEVLGHFTQKGHPGEPSVRTGWIPEKWLARWQLAARGVAVDAVRRGGLALLDSPSDREA